ncbi:hypothetical protein [Halococcus agarilyticus]|uniref:hypothetical protein n=1 Tax=Halococcus agarilyticus TaxID=1232219 RepID=UPI0006778D11|nr:hypothetical protein [Halococcus agarilyticus]
MSTEDQAEHEDEATTERIRPFDEDARDLAATAIDVAERLTTTREFVLLGDQLAWREESLPPEQLRQAAAEGDDAAIERAARNQAIDNGPYVKARWEAMRSVDRHDLNEGHLVSAVVFAVFVALLSTGGVSWAAVALPIGLVCAYAAYRLYHAFRTHGSRPRAFVLGVETDPVSVEVVLDDREPEAVALWHLHREYATGSISEELHEAATKRVLRHYGTPS